MKRSIRVIKTFHCNCGSKIDITCYKKLQGEQDNIINCTVCINCFRNVDVVDDSGRYEKFMKKWNI